MKIEIKIGPAAARVMTREDHRLIHHDPDFPKRFADLLRRAEAGEPFDPVKLCAGSGLSKLFFTTLLAEMHARELGEPVMIKPDPGELALPTIILPPADGEKEN